MDDSVGAADDVVGLPEVGQVGDDAQAVSTAVASQVDVEHVVAAVAEVTHHPPAGLAAPAGDDDPHQRPALNG